MAVFPTCPTDFWRGPVTEQLVIASGISKSYRQLDSTWSRLRAVFAPNETKDDSFVALSPMDLTLQRGESLGIVGRNGSGKSTLLAIIAGVLVPTSGSVELRGRLAALLELGSGFDPEFTGRENAYFNGALHGLPKAEMEKRFPYIEAFAEIGNFIDRPVKTYSSGMFVRLAFSVAVHIDPDILIVDESLSVGDVFFQQKCFERLREMRAAGTSLLFVSHDGTAVQRFCDRAILLDHGQVVMEDVPRVVIDAYETRALREDHHRSTDHEGLPPAESHPRDQSDESTLDVPESTSGEPNSESERKFFETHLIDDTDVAAWNVMVLAGGAATAVTTGDQPFTLHVSITARQPLNDPHVGFKVRDRMGIVVYESNTYCLRMPVGPLEPGETLKVDFSVTTALAPGDYTFTVGAANGGYGDGLFEHAFLYLPDAAALRVLRDNDAPAWSGIVDLQPTVTITRTSVEVTL
jgi:ABC-type polysaccharide/polyol phosphate transport system ATPase subunit